MSGLIGRESRDKLRALLNKADGIETELSPSEVEDLRNEIQELKDRVEELESERGDYEIEDEAEEEEIPLPGIVKLQNEVLTLEEKVETLVNEKYIAEDKLEKSEKLVESLKRERTEIPTDTLIKVSVFDLVRDNFDKLSRNHLLFEEFLQILD
jgi:DNA repair exonuclease SbcCD ATPase subunit